MHSLRYAFRDLSRRPGFAGVAILTLALGIGATAAIFSVIDAVLLRPLPFPDADRIVVPWEYSEDVRRRLGFDRLPSSPADATDFHARTVSFSSFASLRSERVDLTGSGDPERVGGVRVGAEFFEVLGVQPAVGRLFAPGDEGRGRVVVIAHGLWQRRFASDPAISGRVVSINGEPATIVGVLPPWFTFPAAGDLPENFGFDADAAIWTLEVLTPAQQRIRGGKSRALIGRLKPGVSLKAAEADLAGIAADIAREAPQTNAGWTVRVITLREQLVGRMRPALTALLVAVVFVLLIVCANVANLLLLRATSRQREICLRAALGAGRWSLVVQLLVESLVLAVIAGLSGLAVAWGMLRLLLASLPTALPAVAGAGLDWRVLGFTLLVSATTGIVFGLAPAWQATRCEAADALREGARGAVGGRGARRTRNALVVIEVALAAVLLIGAALLVQTFVRLTRLDLGFQSARVLTLEIALPTTAYPPARAAAFFETLLSRVSALPGVEAAAVTSDLPLNPRRLAQVTVEGHVRPEPGQEIIADHRMVSPGYFGTLAIALIEGEPLPSMPRPGQPGIVLVNETLARTSWPGDRAIGRRLKLASYDADAPWYTVVGVVGDTRDSDLRTPPRPQVYASHQQNPQERMSVVLRTSGDPVAAAAPVRAAVLAIDPNQPVARVRTMDAIVASTIARQRFLMFLVGLFAALAVTLSLVGLYGVVSYSVAERIPEMGVRLALGARPWHLLTLVLSEGLRLVAAGSFIGVCAALALAHWLPSLGLNVPERHLAIFVGVPSLLLVAAVVGCLVPARRAMRTDPAIALRSE